MVNEREQLIQAYYNDASMQELLDIHGEDLWKEIEGAGSRLYENPELMEEG